MTLFLLATGAAVGATLGAVLRRRRYLEADQPALGWWAVVIAASSCAVAMGLMAWRIDDPVSLLLGCVFVAGGVVATWTDLDAHLLLDALTWPLAGVLLLIITADAASSGHWERWWAAVLAAGAVAGVLLAWALFGSLGVGDVKFGLSVGLVLGYVGGWPLTLRGVLVSLILAAAAAVVLLAVGRSRKSHLPLGPAFVVGVSGCLLW